jgi:hypothetical protein
LADIETAVLNRVADAFDAGRERPSDAGGDNEAGDEDDQVRD